MQSVFAATTEGSNPMRTLATWINQLRSQERPERCPWEVADRKTGVICDWLSDTQLQQLQLWRTPDRVSVCLFRKDGTLVGDLEGPELSVGQRCTAVLALLLARDDVPIIIDQPEEDLDNEFVFLELVPLLRRLKEHRQIIVVSHNANIPVNADAELVIALEVRKKRGRVRNVAGSDAIGALDNKEVKTAVEDIMEGSELALKRRFDKYGF